MTHDQRKIRRALLKGLAASPFVALGAGLPMQARSEEASSVMYQGILEALSTEQQLIKAPDQAINVFDFDAVARSRLSPAHYGYLATGTDNDATVRANRAGFDRFQLRARRLTGVHEVDLSCALFGARYASPIVLAPVGNTRAFHHEGIAVAARAAQTKRVAQILSIGADTSLDAVNRARGEPAWFQLYPVGGWPYIEAIVRRAESAGCPVLIDSGFRRGTDIFKALALGADAVCIGRPYIWGLAAFGQDGVETVLDILNRELALVMRQCGTAALEQIGRDTLV